MSTKLFFIGVALAGVNLACAIMPPFNAISVLNALVAGVITYQLATIQ